MKCVSSGRERSRLSECQWLGRVMLDGLKVIVCMLQVFSVLCVLLRRSEPSLCTRGLVSFMEIRSVRW